MLTLLSITISATVQTAPMAIPAPTLPGPVTLPDCGPAECKHPTANPDDDACHKTEGQSEGHINPSLPQYPLMPHRVQGCARIIKAAVAGNFTTIEKQAGGYIAPRQSQTLSGAPYPLLDQPDSAGATRGRDQGPRRITESLITHRAWAVPANLKDLNYGVVAERLGTLWPPMAAGCRQSERHTELGIDGRRFDSCPTQPTKRRM